MSPAEVNQYSDTLSKVITSFAIVVGGAWALWTFVISREAKWNLQLNVVVTDIPYLKGLRFVTVSTYLRNVGKVKISPGTKGCTVEVREFGQDLVLGQIAEWAHASEIMNEAVDVLKPYRKDGRYPNYEIEPGAEYREFVNIIASENVILMIKTMFWWKDDDDAITDYCIFLTGNRMRDISDMEVSNSDMAPQRSKLVDSSRRRKLGGRSLRKPLFR